MTGLAPSAVTTVDICPPVAAGQARCQARAMVLRATRAFVRPRAQATARRRQRAVVTHPQAVVQPVAAVAPDAGTPAYLQQAYDMAYLSQTGGAGDTVAVVDAYDDPTAEADLAVYRSTYGLGPCTTANGCFKKVNQTGATSPLPRYDSGWETEISLDLDAVSALCPRCKILLVEATNPSWSNLHTAVATAASLGAKQISNSWAAQFNYVPAASFMFAGVSTIAATGDQGYLGFGLDNYPAAYAGVTAAGGTSLAAVGDGSSPRGFAEAAWVSDDGTAASSGCDWNMTKPAYQPDSGCGGRAYADLSADADPDTGLIIYDSGRGGWLVMGGTSLASPLIAAYYAASGIAATTPQWAYASRALLNDPLGGSNGSCDSALAYICTAGVGYDGPTGIGSISGAIVDGAPGIGGPAYESGDSNTYVKALGTQSAGLEGGVYPNGLATRYWWQYGTSTAYGDQTPATDIGDGRALLTVTDQLSGLDAGTTYHYRLVAQNSRGTSYGYDYSLTTPASSSGSQTTSVGPGSSGAPINVSPPAIAGTPQRTVALSTTVGQWNPAATGYAIQWQRQTATGFVDIAGATGSTYTAVKADEGARLRVFVTARNASGSASAISASVGPVAAKLPVARAAPAITGVARQGAWLRTRAIAWTATPPGSAFAVQWQRCRADGRGCRPIRGATTHRYRLTSADAGHRLVVSVLATNADGTARSSSRPTAVVLPARPVVRTLPSLTGGSAAVGSVLRVRRAVWRGPVSSTRIRFQRCSAKCVAIATRSQSSYRLTAADVGAVIRVTETATNAGGSTTVWSSKQVGPVRR